MSEHANKQTKPLMSLQHLDMYYESKRGLLKEPFRVGAVVCHKNIKPFLSY